MKKSVFILFAMSMLLFSCSKKYDHVKKDDSSYYYAIDYKDASGDILGADIEDIDQLYSVFFYEGKSLKYKLVAEKFDENCNGDCKDKKSTVLVYEEGFAPVAETDLSIQFKPASGDSYSGQFEQEKKSYVVTLPGTNTREITFVLK